MKPNVTIKLPKQSHGGAQETEGTLLGPGAQGRRPPPRVAEEAGPGQRMMSPLPFSPAPSPVVRALSVGLCVGMGLPRMG